jgi:hypothetical protein
MMLATSVTNSLGLTQVDDHASISSERTAALALASQLA